MSTKKIKVFFILAFVASSSGSDFTRLPDNCLKGNDFDLPKDIECTTGKGVKVTKIRSLAKTFYCIQFEKNSGEKKEFDVLSFDLRSSDYDLQFIGANVLDSNETNPTFKIYDIRFIRTYLGRFAFFSDNPDFDINGIRHNGDLQTCENGGFVAWPKSKETAASECGTIKKIGGPDNHSSLPSFPGQFPWTAAIYRYVDSGQSHYKCAGTIISTRSILTSANCLLENGLMLEPNDLLVHLSPYALTDRAVKSNMFTVAELKPHDRFDFQLRNNIAVVKLYRAIVYNDFIQPICMPNVLFLANEKTGKLAGFGAVTADNKAKTLLTEAEFLIGGYDDLTFEAENTSGNSQISDIGAGLFVNVTNRWTLAGVMSRPLRRQDSQNLFVFTNVAKYSPWIKAIDSPPQLSP